MIRYFKRWRLPIIYQSSISECGLACLAMVAQYYDKSFSLRRLREIYRPSLRGMTFRDLSIAAEELKLQPKAFKVNKIGLDQLKLPAILHWNKDHFVILKSVHKNKVIIHDPAIGKKIIGYQEFDERFSGFVMTFNPEGKLVNINEEKPLSVFSVFKGFTSAKRAILKVIAITLLLEIVVNLLPLYTQVVVDQIISFKDEHLLLIVLLLYLGLSFFSTLFSLARSWLIIRFSNLLSVHVQEKIFSHMLKLPVTYYEQRNIGDILSRFGSLDKIQSTFTTGAIEGLIDGVMSIIVLIIMLKYSVYLTLVPLGYTLFYTLIQWHSFSLFKRTTEEEIIASASLETHFIESIKGIRSIKTFDQNNRRMKQWKSRLYKAFNKKIKMQYLQENYGEAMRFLGLLEQGVLLYLGALFVMNGSLSIGVLMAFIVYKNQFLSRIAKVISLIIDLLVVRVHVERVADIVSTKTEQDLVNNIDSASLPTFDLSINNLSIRYSTFDPWIIKDFNMLVPEGEHVVIVGGSGMGKTTILKAILGFMDYEQGDIKIGEHSITQSNSYLRKYISCVLQDDELFSGTILQNITFFDPSFDREKLEKSAKIAEIHADINAMKMGYQTIIGDNGMPISGGQKQRIILARALYKSPKILILDEATSHLDMPLEKKIIANISEMNITRISISHRQESMKLADRIITID